MLNRVRSILRTSDVIVAAIAVLALLLASCSGDGAETDDPATTTTTTASTVEVDAPSGETDDVVFGRGELPSTIPADFPIPEQAVIGSTLVDRTRGVTEVIITYPASVVEVAVFFDTNLPVLGYAIDSSSGTNGSWTIEFSSDTSTGVLKLDVAGSGLTQSVLTFVTPTSG